MADHKEDEHKPSRDGGFSDPSFVSIGDPYVTVREKNRGIDGGQRPFLTCPPKEGQIAATFGPGFRKFEGLPGDYIDRYKLEAKRRLENTKLYAKPNGFVYSSPTKEQTSSGDLYGTFTHNNNEEDTSKAASKSAVIPERPNPKERFHEKRNVLTSPSKRGTYGYSGTLLGGQVLPAMAAEYGSERQAQKKQDESHRLKMGQRKPFKSMAANVDFFDTHEHVAASMVFGWDDQCIAKPVEKTALVNPKERAAARASTFKPWKPANPPKLGEDGSFEKFPERQPDPFDERIVNHAMLPLRRNPVKVATQDLPASLKDRKAFKPSSGPKSKLTKGTCLLGITKHHV